MIMKFIKRCEEVIERVNKWVSFIISIISFTGGSLAYINNNSIGMLLVIFPFIFFLWAFIASFKDVFFNSRFISLRKAILELRGNEEKNRIKELADLADNLRISKDDYIVNFYVQNFENKLFGKEIALQKPLEKRIKIKSQEVLSSGSGNKWVDDYNGISSSSGELLYTDIAIEKKLLNNIKNQMKEVLHEYLA